jgi:hypothetical protein
MAPTFDLIPGHRGVRPATVKGQAVKAGKALAGAAEHALARLPGGAPTAKAERDHCTDRGSVYWAADDKARRFALASLLASNSRLRPSLRRISYKPIYIPVEADPSEAAPFLEGPLAERKPWGHTAREWRKPF